METIYKTSTPKASDDRKVRFVISDSSKDRHGTVLNMNNWNLENFNNNGIVGYQHDVYGAGLCKGADPDSVIGKGRAWIEETRDTGDTVLMGEVDFEPEDVNPLAEKIYKKVLNGTLKATSVGFAPIKNEKGEKGQYGYVNDAGDRVDESTFYFHGQELLEFSIVNIPANPNALKRDLRNQTANALQFIKRQLGEGWTYGDIEELKVVDVIKMLEKDEKPSKRKLEVTIKGEDLAKIVDKKPKETEEIHESARGEGAIERRKRQLTTIKTIEECYG